MPASCVQPRFVPYNVARPHIFDADLLSYHSPRWSASERAISIAGRGPDFHSACAAWEDDRLVAYGMRMGQQKVRFVSDEVESYPGRIDVYRLVPFYNAIQFTADGVELCSDRLSQQTRREIVGTMRDLAIANHYGWRGVLRAALCYLPLARWIARPSTRDIDARRTPPFCSQAYAYAVRQHWVDLIPGLADQDTLPADLPRSNALIYLFTLTPSVEFPAPLRRYMGSAECAHLSPC